MLRRSFITVILIIAIVLGSLPVDAEATESSIYQSSAMQELLDTYLYNEDYLNILTTDSGIGYWKDVNELHKKQRASNLFDWGSGMLNEKYTKEDYAELLTYLMAANEVCLTEMIENTASFDKDYNLRDFSMDMLGIATDVLSTTNNLGLTEEGSALDRIVGTAVDTIGDAAKLKEDFAENKKYYYTILQEYTSNIMFLSAIYKNTTIDDLKEVSEKMMQIEMKGLMTKIEYLGDNLESFVEFEGQIYVENLALPTLQIIAKENGYELAEIVAGGFGKLVDTVFSEGALTFDLIMTFVGDLTFATTDTYRRQNELIALAEAARCVSIECDQITIDNSPGKTTLEKIEKKLYYYSLLLRIHARGEYSLYKMISNKMNILVCFEEDVTDLKNFVKSIFQGTPFVKERPYEDWIKSQLSSLTEMESVVNSLRDSIQYISSRSYVTGKVLCKDTGKGAFNAFLELESEENFTFLMAKEGGNVKGYVTPGSYRCTVILDGYEDYVTDIVIKEEGTNIGTIVLKREGEPEEAGNEAVDNDEIIEQYKAFIQSKNTGSDYQNYIIYDIDKGGFWHMCGIPIASL